MAAVSLFWDTNMAAMPSFENTQYLMIMGYKDSNPTVSYRNRYTIVINR